MFEWTGAGVTVNSPVSIAGDYSANDAAFGPGINGETGELVIVDDNSGPSPTDACETLTNAAAINGKIAVIDRGDCTFVIKVKNAQNAGAIGVIMVNNVATAPVTMGGTDNTINIPSVMISKANGETIRSEIPTVEATLQNFLTRDSDLDNGIIAHEYW